jgi:hypothetical protein
MGILFASQKFQGAWQLHPHTPRSTPPYPYFWYVAIPPIAKPVTAPLSWYSDTELAIYHDIVTSGYIIVCQTDGEYTDTQGRMDKLS